MSLDLAVIIGSLTVFFSLLAKIIGFPDQIRKNLKRKSTEGLSSVFFLISFVSYALWTAHGFIKNDMVVIAGQGLGVVTTGIILYQIMIYKKS